MWPIIRRLKANLDSRFSRVYTPAAINFDPIYALATYLDPRYTLLLDGDLLDLAKRELKLLVSSTNIFYVQYYLFFSAFKSSSNAIIFTRLRRRYGNGIKRNG